MEKDKFNISTTFLVKPLGIIGKEEKIMESSIGRMGFISAYMRDKNKEIDDDHLVYLLFKPTDPLEFEIFTETEYELATNKVVGRLVEDYDYPDGHVVLVYKFPEVFYSDYDKIMLGKYSETSNKFQNMFPQTVLYEGKPYIRTDGANVNKGMKIPSLYYEVFNKTIEQRRMISMKYLGGEELPPDMEVYKSPHKDTPPYLEEEEILNIENI